MELHPKSIQPSNMSNLPITPSHSTSDPCTPYLAQRIYFWYPPDYRLPTTDPPKADSVQRQPQSRLPNCQTATKNHTLDLEYSGNSTNNIHVLTSSSQTSTRRLRLSCCEHSSHSSHSSHSHIFSETPQPVQQFNPEPPDREVPCIKAGPFFPLCRPASGPSENRKCQNGGYQSRRHRGRIFS